LLKCATIARAENPSARVLVVDDLSLDRDIPQSSLVSPLILMRFVS